MSLLVQIPGPDGSGLLLEDLRNGQQRLFDSADELLAAVAESVRSPALAGGATSSSSPSSAASRSPTTNQAPDKEPA